jgi:hypothetical protein
VTKQENTGEGSNVMYCLSSAKLVGRGIRDRPSSPSAHGIRVFESIKLGVVTAASSDARPYSIDNRLVNVEN